MLQKIGILLSVVSITALTGLASATDLLDIRVSKSKVVAPTIINTPEIFMGDDNLEKFYLRGDISINLSSNSAGKTEKVPDNLSNTFIGALYQDRIRLLEETYKKTFSGSVGIGYYFNSELRTDATFEYLTKTQMNALNSVVSLPQQGNSIAKNQIGNFINTQPISAKLSGFVGLANIYYDVDLGYAIKPYVGVGMGMSYLTIDNIVYNDNKYDKSKKNNAALASAATIGLIYDINEYLSLDTSYRFINFGKHESLLLDKGSVDITNDKLESTLTIEQLAFHQITFGLRYKFNF